MRRVEPASPGTGRMKILLINDYATPTAGAEITLEALRDGLRRRGHEVRVFASRAELIPGPSFADDTCFGTTSPLQALSSTVNLSARRSLKRALDEYRPDVVHIKMFLWQLSPMILGPLRGYRSIYHMVVYKPICPTGRKMLPDGSRCESQPGRVCLRSRCMTLPSWAAMMVQHHLWRRDMDTFDALVTTSRAMKKRLEAEGVGPCRIIPNGCRERQPRPPLGNEPRLAYLQKGIIAEPKTEHHSPNHGRHTVAPPDIIKHVKGAEVPLRVVHWAGLTGDGNKVFFGVKACLHISSPDNLLVGKSLQR